MALLDAATEKHLDAWLQREFNEDERPEKKAGMLRIFAEDPERWADRGWPAVRDEARNRPPPAASSSAGTERRRGFDVIRADVSLHERIARALGWSLAETQSVPYPGLRDLVRPVSAALAEEISEVINLGGHVKGPRHSARQAVPPGKSRCSICGKVGSKANLAKHEAKCKSGDAVNPMRGLVESARAPHPCLSCGVTVTDPRARLCAECTERGVRGGSPSARPATVPSIALPPGRNYPRWRQNYSNERSDRVSQFAAELTDEDRAAGRPSPPAGASRERLAEAQRKVWEAQY